MTWHYGHKQESFANAIGVAEESPPKTLEAIEQKIEIKKNSGTTNDPAFVA